MYWRMCVTPVSWESFGFVGSRSSGTDSLCWLTVSCLPLLQTFPIPRREAVCSRWKVKDLIKGWEEAWFYPLFPYCMSRNVSLTICSICVCTKWEGNQWYCSVCKSFNCISDLFICTLSCSKCGTLPPESCFFSLICSTGSFMGKMSCAHTQCHNHLISALISTVTLSLIFFSVH